MKGSTYQGEMGKYKVSMLLLWVFFALCNLLVLKVEARAYSSSLETEIEAKLKLLNKPAVKSIKSEDGDIIDCVDIYKQPAFDHPALKNHTIQEDLLRAASLDLFGRKPLEPNNRNLHFPNLDATTDDVASSMINRSKDSYKSTGCFDLTCHGFVQIATEVAIGSHLGPYSRPFDQQYEINIGLFQDDDGNWWLRVRGNTIVGYWPKEMLGNLGHSATLVQWGGQVFSYKVKSTPPHTGTQMGSGEEASEPYCYSALNDVHYGKYPVFYFGGPGRNRYCN
ncbi:hypothetical protein TSUD_315510 [Trifolium subterraneum]|uniref:Neprosin PEP catalytic domain-containing protein n=1 Tax=Trifolium subterraneum TaxID=3900 RepID=A0A2Z6MHZ6_TRISU|nr:hypothetical protein TSUD_315510 [Trifolium subterraneum]